MPHTDDLMAAAEQLGRRYDRLRRAIIAGVVAVGLLDVAAAHAATFASIGSGNESCGAWTADYRMESLDGEWGWSTQQVVNQNADLGWVLGFLSGLGFQGNGNSLLDTDARGVEAWISNYCAQNPAQEVIDAAKAFAQSRGAKL